MSTTEPDNGRVLHPYVMADNSIGNCTECGSDDRNDGNHTNPTEPVFDEPKLKTYTELMPDFKVGAVQHNHAEHLAFYWPDGRGFLAKGCAECATLSDAGGGYHERYPNHRPNCLACLGENL